MNLPPDLNQNLLLKNLVEGDLAVAVFDSVDQMQYANKVFRNLFQIEQHASILSFSQMMRDCYEQRKGLIIDTDDFPAWLETVQNKRRTMTQRSFESDFHDGSWVWGNETRAAEGSISFIGSNITQLKNNEKVLRNDRDCALQAAQTDPLTGLYNRRFVFQRLAEACERSRLHGVGTITVCMLDLDNFKWINDTYGHPVGDRVLQHFSTLARSLLRPQDILSRIGGEEFLLLLPDTTTTSAAQILKRLRHAMKKNLACAEFPALHYTFSAGLSAIGMGDCVEGLIQRVDTALYCAKQAGRNRQVVV
jgi:diguanylate cyclase (GGDEF)-like protein